MLNKVTILCDDNTMIDVLLLLEDYDSTLASIGETNAEDRAEYDAVFGE